MLVGSDDSVYLAINYLSADGQYDWHTVLQKLGPDGSPRWQADPFPYEETIPKLDWDQSGNIVIYHVNNLEVYSVGGLPLRLLSLPISLRSERVAYGRSNEMFISSGTNSVDRFSAEGELLGSKTVGGPVLSVDADADQLYVTCNASGHWFDLNFGEFWDSSLESAPTGVSELDGVGNLMSLRSQRLVRLKKSGLVSAYIDAQPSTAMTAGAGQIVAAGKDGTRIRVFSFRNGIDHDTATLIRGRTTENSHFAMMHSGDGYWSIAPGAVFSNQQAPISMILSHTAPPENPQEMAVTLESRGTANGVKQSVEVYNFANSTWTSLESNVVLPFGGSPDRYAILSIANPTAHIGPGRKIRVRIEYRNDSPVFIWPWQARIDREFIRFVT